MDENLLQFFCKRSSINFCEDDYIYSIYIAEFYNTLSGIFLCLSSILFYYKYIKHFNENLYFKNKLYNINFLLFIVGFGTILFHSHLLYIFQLVDEIPMLLIVMNYLNLLYELKLETASYFNFNLAFQIKIISIICISGFINDTLQVLLFQGTMIICSLKYVFVTNKISANYSNKKNIIKNFSINSSVNYINYIKDITYYHNICFKIAIFSFSLWLIEQMFCDYVKDYYFHAIWHFLTSIGMYYYNYITLLYIKLSMSESIQY